LQPIEEDTQKIQESTALLKAMNTLHCLAEILSLMAKDLKGSNEQDLLKFLYEEFRHPLIILSQINTFVF